MVPDCDLWVWARGARRGGGGAGISGLLHQDSKDGDNRKNVREYAQTLWHGVPTWVTVLIPSLASGFLCTGAFIYVCCRFLLISNKFCDLSLLHWTLEARYDIAS